MNIDDKSKSENDLQRELEDGMKYFFPFFTLNHGVHQHAVFSKWHISDEFETDMMYVTKSSDEWWVVFVEFEHPSLKILTSKGSPTSKFTKGLDQIYTWKAYADSFKERIKERLENFLAPLNKLMLHNPITFKYLLIAGRKSELKDSSIIRKIKAMGNDDIKIKTWDSMFENAERYIGKLNVITTTSGKYSFKNMNSTPPLMYMDPRDYILTKEQIESIKSEGHDYYAWMARNHLVFTNGIYQEQEKGMKELFKSCAQRNKENKRESKKPSKKKN